MSGLFIFIFPFLGGIMYKDTATHYGYICGWVDDSYFESICM